MSIKLKIVVVLLSIIHTILCQALYNHDSASYRNKTWMSLFDNGIPLRKMSIMGTHSSMSIGTWGDAFQTQASSLKVQLQTGYRALDIRCRHKNNAFPIYERLIDLRENFDDVLNIIQNFLRTYPSETILVHVVQEYNPSGNSRSFEQTYIMYRDMFPNLIWNPTTQNPTLGMTRGKVVIIQNFVGAIHGLLYGSFKTIQHKKYSTNWDQHDRWIDIKKFIAATDEAGSSRISFWTGSGGSFPYFAASGKSSPGTNHPRLATGLTTPGFRSYYPDFPRVACFIGICTIAFEGINILGYNYITANNFQYLGIIFTDFAGDTLVSSTLMINSRLFGVCTVSQLSKGCTVCTTAGVCLACNQDQNYRLDADTELCIAAPGYYLNVTSYPQLCSQEMPGCLECESESVCILCDTYIKYQLLDDECQAADGYYLDTNSIPAACSILGCYLCQQESICTNCSDVNNFIMDGNGDCMCDTANNFQLLDNTCICSAGYFLKNSTCEPMPLCPDANSGCLTCSGNSCSVCDADNNFIDASPYCKCDSGFYYDGIECQLCNQTQAACEQCLSDDLCMVCTNNFTLIEGICQCSEQFYQHDADTCLSCQIGCLECTSTTACDKCDTDSFFQLIGGICECQKGKFVQNPSEELCVPCGALPGCVACDMNGCIQCDEIFGFTLNDTQCFCDFGEYISIMNVCTQCRMQGCQDCDTATNCVDCDTTNYYLNEESGLCLEICGDSRLFNLQCDDGNKVDGDGCSSTCKIEKNYTCSGGSSRMPSACSFSGTIAIDLIQFIKNPYKNEVVTKFKLSPSLKAFDAINFDECIVPNFPYTTRVAKYDSQTNEVQYTFTYNKSLNTQDLSIELDPPDTLQFYYTKSTKLSMPYTTDNNLSLKAYSDDIYTQIPALETLVQILLYLSLCVFIFALFFSSKLMGVEMIEVIQFAYLGLVIMDKLEALIYPLVLLRPTNGYNTIVADNQANIMPSRVSIPGYQSWFLANFSLNFIICVLPLVVGLILYAVSKLYYKTQTIGSAQLDNCDSISEDQQKQQQIKAKQTKLRRLSFRIMKQWQISLLLFIQFHLIASIVFGIKYGVDNIIGIVAGSLVVIAFLVMCFLLYRRPLNFGEYKDFFMRTNNLSYNYYIFVVIYRIALTAGIAMLNQSEGCGYYAIALTSLQTIILIVVRPYKKNIRPIINSLFMVAIAVIYTIYRLVIIDDTQWITTNLPIMLLAILFVSVIFNLIFIILYLVNSCKSQKQTGKQTGRQIGNIEMQMNLIVKKQLDTMRIISPHGAQFTDNPASNILKQLRVQMQMSNILPPEIHEKYMNQYDAI